MALVIGVPTYVGFGPLGSKKAISAVTVGSATVDATVTTTTAHGFVFGNTVFFSASTGGTGTWNTTWTVSGVVSPTSFSLKSSSTLTGAPTVTNASVQLLQMQATGGVGNARVGGEAPIQGLCVIKGDGSILQAQINYVDGTATIPFTPTAVDCMCILGGTSDDGVTTVETALTVGVANIQTITNTGFLLNYAVVPTNVKTNTIFFTVYR